MFWLFADQRQLNNSEAGELGGFGVKSTYVIVKDTDLDPSVPWWPQPFMTPVSGGLMASSEQRAC